MACRTRPRRWASWCWPSTPVACRTAARTSRNGSTTPRRRCWLSVRTRAAGGSSVPSAGASSTSVRSRASPPRPSPPRSCTTTRWCSARRSPRRRPSPRPSWRRRDQEAVRGALGRREQHPARLDSHLPLHRRDLRHPVLRHPPALLACFLDGACLLDGVGHSDLATNGVEGAHHVEGGGQRINGLSVRPARRQRMTSSAS